MCSCRPLNPCDAPAVLAGTLCMECRARLEENLRQLPGIYDQLGFELAPSRRQLERVSGSKHTGLMINEKASAVRSEVVSLLSSWAGSVAQELGITAPDRKVIKLAVFLLRHLSAFESHSALRDLASEIANLVIRVRDVLDSVSVKVMALGRCISPGCGHEILSISDPRMGGQHTVQCQAGHAWPAEQWLLLRKEVQDLNSVHSDRRTLPSKMAAAAMGVSEATIRKWVSRGKLTRYGTAAKAEYDMNELSQLATYRGNASGFPRRRLKADPIPGCGG